MLKIIHVFNAFKIKTKHQQSQYRYYKCQIVQESFCLFILRKLSH